MTMKKTNDKAEIVLMKSSQTDKLYIAMTLKQRLYKLWDVESLGPAAIDFIDTLMKAFDNGYDLTCQLPAVCDGIAKILPYEYKLNDEMTPADPNKNAFVRTIKNFLSEDDVIFYGQYANQESENLLDISYIIESYKKKNDFVKTSVDKINAAADKIKMVSCNPVPSTPSTPSTPPEPSPSSVQNLQINVPINTSPVECDNNKVYTNDNNGYSDLNSISQPFEKQSDSILPTPMFNSNNRDIGWTNASENNIGISPVLTQSFEYKQYMPVEQPRMSAPAQQIAPEPVEQPRMSAPAQQIAPEPVEQPRMSAPAQQLAPEPVVQPRMSAPAQQIAPEPVEQPRMSAPAQQIAPEPVVQPRMPAPAQQIAPEPVVQPRMSAPAQQIAPEPVVQPRMSAPAPAPVQQRVKSEQIDFSALSQKFNGENNSIAIQKTITTSPKEWVCSNCGTFNQSGRFCQECGTKYVEEEPISQPTVQTSISSTYATEQPISSPVIPAFESIPVPEQSVSDPQISDFDDDDDDDVCMGSILSSYFHK